MKYEIRVKKQLKSEVRKTCRPHINRVSRCWQDVGLLVFFMILTYLGKNADTDMCKKYGKVGAVVIKLVETLPKNVGHKVYMENLFSSTY